MDNSIISAPKEKKKNERKNEKARSELKAIIERYLNDPRNEQVERERERERASSKRDTSGHIRHHHFSFIYFQPEESCLRSAHNNARTTSERF